MIGPDAPIAVQTMLNTRTSDVEASLAQAVRVADAGARLIRLTVPAMSDVEALRQIHSRFRALGYTQPLVADVHFSPDIAMAAAAVVEKVRINPGNFHPDHAKARDRFAALLEECKRHGTAIRIGLNHGSLGRYITERFGNTPEAMALAAMEWVKMCMDASFRDVVVSLKASNTVVMIQAYRALYRMMKEEGCVFPLHVGVTEAGNGDSGRIKSAVAISTLLSEGIGNTVRVSLTEPPEAEIPVAAYLASRYDSRVEAPQLPEHERLILEASCDYGKKLLDREIDDISFPGIPDGDKLADELMQACRRRFTKPEYIACPGCGRTLYNLEETFDRVKAATSGFKGIVIAVMGCIVNGPGEMADADYGYVGEGRGLVTLYKGKEPVLRHIPQEEAVDRLVALIKENL